MNKPRSTICWECGRQLIWRRIHIEMVVDGHSRILHKECAKNIKNDQRSFNPLGYDDKDGELFDEHENPDG